MVRKVGFSSFVQNWVAETKERMDAVFVTSAEDLIKEAQANSPVDTGFNAANVVVNINDSTPPPLRNPDDKDSAPAIEVTINAGAGDIIHAWFAGAYAARLEYGFSGVDSLGRYYEQPPSGYVRRAAQNWPFIVARNTRRLAASIAFSTMRG